MPTPKLISHLGDDGEGFCCACVFDNDAYTSGLDALADFAESPDAGIHLDDGADTLVRYTKPLVSHWLFAGLKALC